MMAGLLLSIAACASDNNGGPADGGATPAVAGSPSPTGGQGNQPSPTPAPTPTGAQIIEDIDPDEGPRHGGVLRVISGGAAEGAGPIGVPWTLGANDIALAEPMMEPLVRERPDGSIIHLLAEGHELDHENLTLTFFLRQNVRFHDGTPFNAEVAKWNLEMANENAAALAVYDNIVVVDEHTIRMDVPRITNSTVGGFGGMMYTMISMEAYLANGTEWAQANPVGTGPFVFHEYIGALRLVALRNDDYWDGDKPYFDAVEIHMIGDQMVQTLALDATTEESIIHMMTTNVGEQVSYFMNSDNHNILFSSNLAIALFPDTANEDSPFYDNIYTRLALSYAIDRDALVAARGFGLWVPAYQYTVAARPSFVDEPGYGVPRFDPERAREMLALGGFPDGFSTTLIAQPGAADRDAVVAIQAMLQNVGINAGVEFPQAGAFSTMRGSHWDGVLVHAILSMTHMENSLSLLFANREGNNFFNSMVTSEHLDEMIRTASNTFGDNRAELRAIQDYMLGEGLIIPMWFLSSGRIMRSNVRGWNEFNQFFYPDGWFAE
jgi:ABC-type transport system substrate-binding protein